MTDTINTRFARAWESVENPPLDSVNPHFKNKFASLGATLRVIRKACKSNGIAYLQAFDAMRTEDGMEAVIRTWVSDGGGERIELSCMRFPITDNPQQLGSAMTYCRRYVAQLDWGILGEEDDDAERAMPQQQPPQKPKPKKQEHEELADIWQECIDLGVTKEGLNSWYEANGYKGKKLSQLTAAERKHVKSYLLDMRKGARQVL